MIASPVFIDTGAFFALQVQDDAHYEEACEALPLIISRGSSLITSNFIVAETFTLLRVSKGFREAHRFLEYLGKSPRLRIVYSDPTIEEEACAILSKFADHPLSYADGVSFAIMNRLRITHAFAFDIHFRIAGFHRMPLDG
jgi:uncharacterized protein